MIPSVSIKPGPNDEAVVRVGFHHKLIRVAAKIPFAADALALYFAARDPATPRKVKAMMIAALAYFVMPADAIPDVFAGIGFTDDAAVIAAVIALAGASIRSRHRDLARAMITHLRSKA